MRIKSAVIREFCGSKFDMLPVNVLLELKTSKLCLINSEKKCPADVADYRRQKKSLWSKSKKLNNKIMHEKNFRSENKKICGNLRVLRE